MAGCAAVGPNYVRPAAIVSAQYKEIKGWKLATPRDDAGKGDWWTVFADTELNGLEKQVSVSNQTLKASEAHYRQAQALIAQARSELYPNVTLTGSTQRDNSGASSSIQANGSWEPDLWGRVRRTIESQVAGAQASAADLANATLSAQSALATAYFQLREADALHELLDKSVAQLKVSLDIAQKQYSTGVTERFDVVSAKAQMLDAQAQEIDVEISRAQSEHAIAILIGRPPAELTVSRRGLGQTIPVVPAGFPSALLERRPDIASAERAMQQQNAQIGVAISAYYPDVTLSAILGGVTGVGAANPVWSIGLDIAQTVFNGGQTEAQVAAARAGYEQNVANYRETVLGAIQQVEDQLVAIRTLAREDVVRAESAKQGREAVDIALTEYRAGTQTYTTVITAQTDMLQEEEAAVVTHGQRFAASVALIVALGGGWTVRNLPGLPPVIAGI